MRHKGKDPHEPGITVLQQLIRHYKVSSRELARKVGVSPSQMFEIVNGHLPKVDTAIRISRYFRKRSRAKAPVDVNSVEVIWGGRLAEAEVQQLDEGEK